MNRQTIIVSTVVIVFLLALSAMSGAWNLVQAQDSPNTLPTEGPSPSALAPTPEPPTPTSPPAVTKTPEPTSTQSPSKPKTTPTPVLPISGGAPQDLDTMLNDYAVPLPPLENLGLDRTPLNDTSAITQIIIPVIKVDSPVQPVSFNGQTWDLSALGDQVAWLTETSLPGQGGNTVMTAHVSWTPLAVPFHDLVQVKRGAIVTVYTREAIYTYKVREQRLAHPDDMSVIAPTGKPQLTLITCTYWDPLNRTYLERRIVFADLISVTPLQESMNFFAPK